MKNTKTPWNHNFAYHGWISKIVGKRNRILDVGCGDGTLAQILRTSNNHKLYHGEYSINHPAEYAEYINRCLAESGNGKTVELFGGHNDY